MTSPPLADPNPRTIRAFGQKPCSLPGAVSAALIGFIDLLRRFSPAVGVLGMIANGGFGGLYGCLLTQPKAQGV